MPRKIQLQRVRLSKLDKHYKRWVTNMSEMFFAIEK